MALCDYGGFAYRSGRLQTQRCDTTLSSAVLGKNPDRPFDGFYHVVLGDGPLYLGLYKQTSYDTWLKRRSQPVQLDLTSRELDLSNYNLQLDHLVELREPPQEFKCARHRVVIFQVEDDGEIFQYARLEQPDGVVWHGWSGYHVGKGFEDKSGTRSVERRERVLKLLFPQDF